MPRSTKNPFPNYTVDQQPEDEEFEMAGEGVGSSSTPESTRRRSRSVAMRRPRRGSVRSRRSEVGSCYSRPRREEAGPWPSSSRGRVTRGRGQACNNRRRRRDPKNLTVAVDEEGEEEQTEEERALETRGTILCWLIDMKMLKEYDEVHCFGDECQRKVATGRISRGGIVCNCCNETFTASRFLHHARADHVDRAYEKIFLSRMNIPLMMCQLQAWNEQAKRLCGGYHHVQPPRASADRHDDSCIICADGGDMICCKKCPSVYHTKCLKAEGELPNDWLCPICECKHCNNANANGSTLFTCTQCRRKYHPNCCEQPVDLNTHIAPFCGTACKRIHRNLERIVGQRHQVGVDLSWTLLRRMDELSASFDGDLYDKTKWNSKIAIASRMMEECFDPIIDRYSKINTIQSVVHNCRSNFTRLDFGRFHTAILEHKDEIISAASIRIHGPKIAEMPCAATSQRWRRQGMFKKLLGGIESALCNLGLEYLTIPSAGETVDTWIKSFKFIAVDNHIEKELAKLNTLTFPGSIRLQKQLRRSGQKIVVHDLNLDPPEEE